MQLIPRHSIFDLDNFFDGSWLTSGRHAKDGMAFSPKVDVRENGDQFRISAELPGVDKDHLSVTLENGILSLDAEMEMEDKEESEGRVVRCERRYGRYMRSFDLGPNVHEGDVDASFKDGVLTLVVPKVHAEHRDVKTIKIN